MPATPRRSRNFGGSSQHQRLMMANLAASLFAAEAITTTEAKAKALRPIAEKLITKAKKAQDGKISMDELTGGTFSITNGGIFGSMMSTPILNQPQSAILGMHNIVQRPMVVDGEIKIRPMMYLALTYDHRIIDGKEAVQFLVSIKEQLEDPSRLLLQV